METVCTRSLTVWARLSIFPAPSLSDGLDGERLERALPLAQNARHVAGQIVYSSARARLLQFTARLLRVVLELLLALPVSVGQTRSSFSACARSGACTGSGARTACGARARSGARASPFSPAGDAKALPGKRLPACFACRFRFAQRLLGCLHPLRVPFALAPGVLKFLQEI